MRFLKQKSRRRLRELSLWCRELGLMLRNGTDLVAALSILEQQAFSRSIRAMTTEMIAQASSEAGIEDLFANRGDIFPPVVIFTLRAGQASQRIPDVLIGLADVMEQAADLGMSLELPLESEQEMVTVDQIPVVRIVNSILRQAAQAGATEVLIHASEEGTHTRVECTVDGVVHELLELPIDTLGVICRRICVMAGINWALKQPGLGTLRLGQRAGDLSGAVQFLPGNSELEHQVRVTLLTSQRQT
ncbi:MAG: type II secretion system F family protein [Candidatus Zipacnadales bacterium]